MPDAPGDIRATDNDENDVGNATQGRRFVTFEEEQKRMRRHLMLAACMAVMLAGLSSAVVASSMSSSGMKHPGDMSFLTGTWSCTSKINAMPGSPAHTENDTMSFNPVMGGTWTSQTYTGKKYSWQAYWRWDKATNTLVSISIDSFGGYGTSTSKGMLGGNSMTMTGSMTYAGRSTASSDLLTHMSNTKMRHVGKVQMNGKWMQTDDTVCTKNP